MPYQRILVAIDLSEESTEVLAAAQAIAASNIEAELSLVSVIRPLQHALGGLDAGAIGVTASLDAQIREETRNTISQQAESADIPQERVHLKEGSPATEIKSTAEEIQADLIVIGTHGRHGLGLLLGSTANGVLHGTQCDVLTIRIH